MSTGLNFAAMGLSVMSAVADSKRLETESEIEQKTIDINATAEAVGVMAQYNNLFEKNKSDLSAQKNVLATIGADKAGSFYNQALKAQEESFLKNVTSSEKDVANIKAGANISKTTAQLNKIYGSQAIGSQLLSNLVGFGSKAYESYKASSGGGTSGK